MQDEEDDHNCYIPFCNDVGYEYFNYLLPFAAGKYEAKLYFPVIASLASLKISSKDDCVKLLGF